MNTGKQSRSVKTLKGQLFSAVAMIVVAAVALGTSTYAWFVNNATVEVENMQLTVSASTSMLVAVGKDGTTKDGAVEDWTGYKTVIINDDITGTNGTDVADWTNMFAYPLDPATTTNALLADTLTNLTFYRSNGHLEPTTMLLDQFNTLKLGRGTDASTPANNYSFVGEGYVKRIPLKFLSSTNVEVFFGKDGLATTMADLVSSINPSGLTQSAVDAISDPLQKADAQKALNEALAIQKALRMSIVAREDAAASPNTRQVTTFQFDDGAAHITGATNNTDYNSQTTTPTIDETKGDYWGIATTSAVTDGSVSTVAPLTAKLPSALGSGYLATVNGAVVTKPTTIPTPLFELDAGVEREVDVFIWLEGTDMDAVSTLSSYKFNLNIPFAGVPIAPLP